MVQAGGEGAGEVREDDVEGDEVYGGGFEGAVEGGGVQICAEVDWGGRFGLGRVKRWDDETQ